MFFFYRRIITRQKGNFLEAVWTPLLQMVVQPLLAIACLGQREKNEILSNIKFPSVNSCLIALRAMRVGQVIGNLDLKTQQSIILMTCVNIGTWLALGNFIFYEGISSLASWHSSKDERRQSSNIQQSAWPLLSG